MTVVGRKLEVGAGQVVGRREEESVVSQIDHTRHEGQLLTRLPRATPSFVACERQFHRLRPSGWDVVDCIVSWDFESGLVLSSVVCRVT